MLFKKYQINHEKISGNYQRVSSIQEFNSKNQAANPVSFSYNNTAGSFSGYEKVELKTLGNLRDVTATGDFNGDGEADVIDANNKLYWNIFNKLGVDNSISSIDSQGLFLGTSINFSTANKLNNYQSILYYRDKNDSELSTYDIEYIKGQKLILKVKDFDKPSNQFKDVYTKEIDYPYANVYGSKKHCYSTAKLPIYTGRGAQKNTFWRF